ncbi:MAG: hypothetical protein ACREUT_02960 [Steroidobacteraceae bacterium]
MSARRGRTTLQSTLLQSGRRAASFEGDFVTLIGARAYLQQTQTVENGGRVKQLTGGSTTG